MISNSDYDFWYFRPTSGFEPSNPAFRNWFKNPKNTKSTVRKPMKFLFLTDLDCIQKPEIFHQNERFSDFLIRFQLPMESWLQLVMPKETNWKSCGIMPDKLQQLKIHFDKISIWNWTGNGCWPNFPQIPTITPCRLLTSGPQIWSDPKSLQTNPILSMIMMKMAGKISLWVLITEFDSVSEFDSDLQFWFWF